jgi:hypothetical protein
VKWKAEQHVSVKNVKILRKTVQNLKPFITAEIQENANKNITCYKHEHPIKSHERTPCILAECCILINGKPQDNCGCKSSISMSA